MTSAARRRGKPRSARRRTVPALALALAFALAGLAATGCTAFRPSPKFETVAPPVQTAVVTIRQPTASAPRTNPDVNRASAVATATVAPTSMTPAVPPAPPYPIDLPTALRLAESINPVIAEARARIGIALGHEQQARALLLPTLNAGTNYFNHTGDFQRSSGTIIKVNEQALYFGGGANAIAQGTVAIPAVNVSAHLTDALFEPLSTHQQTEAVRLDASATANTVLLGVADDYLELRRAIMDLKARERTEAEAAELARVTAAFARTGEGRQADADRAATEWRLTRSGVREAERRAAVASARLVRRLHLDPNVRVLPEGDPMEVVSLVDLDTPQEELVRTAVAARPEIGARSAEVARAEIRLSKERYRPLLPTLWLGFSGGEFGGGSNLNTPTLGNFGPRTDFDVMAYWTLENFGMGNLLLQKQEKQRVGEAVALRSRTINRVREEVSSARADALAAREQIALTLDELSTSYDGFSKDLERLKEAAGPTLEPLNNLQLLRAARTRLIQAVTDYNQAQFRLFVAMGTPPPPDTPSSTVVPPASAAVLAGTATPDTSATASTTPAQRDATHGPLSPLTQAHQNTVKALGDYDRVQTAVLQALSGDGPPPDRKALLQQVRELAEAHRNVVEHGVAYDRALWQAVTDLGDVPPAPSPFARQAGPTQAETPAAPARR